MTNNTSYTDLTQRKSQPCDFSKFLPSCQGGKGTEFGGQDGKGGSSVVTEKWPVSQPYDARQTVAALDCAQGKPLHSPWTGPAPGLPHSWPKPQQHFLRKRLASPSLVLPSSSAHWPATPTPHTAAKAENSLRGYKSAPLQLGGQGHTYVRNPSSGRLASILLTPVRRARRRTCLRGSQCLVPTWSSKIVLRAPIPPHCLPPTA